MRWTRRALADVQAAQAYSRRHHPQATAVLGERVRAAAAHLEAHPQLGRPGRVAGTRALSVSHTPFVIVYRVVPRCVQVVAFLHGARQWPGR
ncbi:MAG: type II toxin-antitoxin system RelE/ParE family toxin [Polyangiales bacterium]